MLISIFDSVENLVNKNYKCGFCDVCNPSLRFEVESANILLEEAEIDDINRQTNRILEEFDRRTIIDVLNKTIERGAVAGLFARVTNVLERSPTNLSALYLAGGLSRQRKDREKIAFDYLEYGFNEGIKQGLSNDNLLIFYEEAALINLEAAYEWLIRPGGRWDNKEGFNFLFQEAKNKFGNRLSTIPYIDAIMAN
ncbi:hypothetical protein NIES4071_24840 [Calothrix sp. NIES-4071]|nr:hypothetical protein NIES4071_24840 [Calothrix sp. NIES-4071]BAZ56807.1 hypothetical protein NIES4105_24780 [Calothrix sp. NIES-4105]